jgi:hypothetical protein
MDDNNKAQAAKTKGKKKKYLILALLPILLVLAVLLELHLSNQPVVGKITASQANSTSTTSYGVNLTPTLQTGKYVSFDYPEGMRLYSDALADPATSLESYSYYVKDLYSWTLAIDITKSGNGQVSETTPYEVRIKDPAMYGESYLSVNGQTVIVFTDKTFSNGFSKVALFAHGNMVATVSLIGNDAEGTSPLQTTFSMVLNTWKWKV